MSSEFSNMKKLPYIPPTSPPPIDSLPEETDYEIPDFDITGLSQKLCDEETSVTHQPLESTLDGFDVTLDSNLNSIKGSNSFNKNVFQKIETIVKTNSEEESSSSITIPPLDCEGQSLNECNISDLENDICDNYVDELNYPRDSTVVINDEGLKCQFESDKSSPSNNSFCQKRNGDDNFENCENPVSHLGNKLKSNVHVNETKEEKISEIEENILNNKDKSCDLQSELESNKFTPNFSNFNLVYDDGGGGRINCIESKENDKKFNSSSKISENYEDDEFSNFVSRNKVDSDDFGNFVSKRNINNKIDETNEIRLELSKGTEDKRNSEDFADFISETHFEAKEIRKSDSKEAQQNTNGENLKKSLSNLDMSDNSDQNDDLGNFICRDERKSSDQDDDDENFGNFVSNFNEINKGKPGDDFGDFAGNIENSPVTLEKRLSDQGNSANNNVRNSGNVIGEKEQGFDTDEDNDDFGDFYSTNVAEETHSEVKLCQENYHDEYLDPSIRYDSPSKFNKYSSANDAESKEDKKESLQLEFSDDEDEIVDKVVVDDEFSHTDDDTVLDPDLKENKFHGYFLRWLPKGSRSAAGGSFLSFSKLNEIIDGTVIWYHAINVESCSALQFSWTNSRINKLYLSSLNVDTRNILLGHRSKWISTIPIFAQALSFSPLTPLKPSTNSVNWNIEESSANIPPDVPYRSGEDASKDRSAKDIQIPDSKNIPPAKFDWNSSGLTNPLNMPEKELLSSLEKDFTATPTAQEFKSSTSLIEEALKKVNYSSSSMSSTQSTSQNDTTQRLPPKVQQIVNSIPNLNFMQSKVLAFPICQTPDFFS